MSDNKAFRFAWGFGLFRRWYIRRRLFGVVA